MISPSTEISLVIQEKESFPIENFQVEVISYLGLLTADVHYFKVNIQSTEDSSNSSKLGLLRVGSLQGWLSRELKLRETLNGYGMIVELLAHCIKEFVLINPPLTSLKQELEESINISPSAVNEKLEDLVIKIEPFSDTLESDREISVDWDYLEEEYYPEKEITSFCSNQTATQH
jgi:PPM family protein phosphatase